MEGKEIRILLIDDDEDDREIFTAAMQEVAPANTCETAISGKEGLRHLMATNQLPDLIFLDLNMPLIHGFECLKMLKENDRLKEIPVVIYSTSNNQPDVQRAAALGASAYLSKPSQYTHLCEKLRNILLLDFRQTIRQHQYLGLI